MKTVPIPTDSSPAESSGDDTLSISAIVEEVPQQIEIMITETGTYLVNGKELINNRVETIRNAIQKVSGGNSSLPLTISAAPVSTFKEAPRNRN